MDVIVEEVEETAEVTDVAWDLKNTSPKVVDEDLEVTQVLAAASMPNNGDMLDFEGMPDLEDRSSEEPMREEPQVDNPPAEGPLALHWVCFKAQIHQDEVWYWAAMFTWFRYMYISWEESRRDNA